MQQTYSTTVEGMTCGNCALTISRLLEKKGLTNISANAGSGEVNFTAPDDTDVNKIFDAIDGLGYHVVRGENKEADHKHADTTHANVLLLICAALTIPLLLHMFFAWHVLHMPWVQFALATPVYVIGVIIFGKSAVRSLKHGLPNMDVLIIIGASAAYLYSLTGLLFFTGRAGDYLFFETAAAIITLVMAGNWLEQRTVKATSSAVDALIKLQPQYARIVMSDSMGKETMMDIETKYVRANDVVIVNTGDNVPVDGIVIFGEAAVDEHMITGESMPVTKQKTDNAVGGTLVLEGSIKIKATTVGNTSVLANIIKMVRDAQAIKTPLQKLADKISAIFVPVVLAIAVLTLLFSYFVLHIGFTEAMMRGIAVLVISCPCAMGLATPAAVAAGLGRAAGNGILIKGGDTLERLKEIRQIVFDKTGTLTTGKMHIEDHECAGISDDLFRSIIVSMERHSSHPIALSITTQWKEAEAVNFKEIEEIKGKGIQATDVDGNVWQLGSGRWLHTAEVRSDHDLYLYKNSQYAGSLLLTDTLRDDARSTVAELKEMGYRVILLTGDKKIKADRLAGELVITDVYAEQTPKQKNDKLEELVRIAPTAMVGDGINDAPALAKASVGISLSESSQIAIQSANIILSDNRLSSLPKAIRLGIYTSNTIKSNLFWAFIYNVIAIPVAAAGYLKPAYGAGIMALSDVVLILNSLRLRVRNINK